MPPTIQSGERNERDNRRKSRTTGPAKSDIVSRVKYGNALPDIPFDPKFITYPFEANRFVQYNATSLERNYKHELLAEHDLGVTIDLINPDTYRIDPVAMLDPADEKLLEEDIATPGDSKRSRQHTKSVSWLRKTEYISSEYNRSVHSRDKAETKVAYSLKKQFNEEDLYKDRDNQIAAIQKTFEDAKVPIPTHYSKPHVTPVEVLSVLPDFDMWIHPCAQVIFDDNPAPKDKPTYEAVEEMSQAMIRGMVDEDGEQFVGYFLPTEDTTKKRKRDFEEGIQYTEEEEYEYKLCKEYNWNVKNKASRGYEENYFMVFRKGEGVFFDELETRVRLSKRRALTKDGVTSNSLLVVKNRALSDQEVALQEARLSQLDNAPPEEEDEDEEEEEDDEETKQDEETKEDEDENQGNESGENEKEDGEEDEDDQMDTEEQDDKEEEEDGERQEESGEEQEASSDRAESGSERGESDQESGAEEDGTQESGAEGQESGEEQGSGSEGRHSGDEGQASGSEQGQSDAEAQESGSEREHSDAGSGIDEMQDHDEDQVQEEREESEGENEEQEESGSEKEEEAAESENEEEENDSDRDRREEEAIFGSDASGNDSD